MNYVFTDEHKELLLGVLDAAVDAAPNDDLDHYFRVARILLRNLEPVAQERPPITLDDIRKDVSLYEQWLSLHGAKSV